MIDEEVLLTAKQQIMNLIEEGYDNGYLSKEEFEALDPSDKGASRFYKIFKVHKSHPPGTIPPSRPIVSGNGSITDFKIHKSPHKRRSERNTILPLRPP